MWCSVPVLKLCAFCLDLPRYKFIQIRDAFEKYSLKKSSLTSMPRLKCNNNSGTHVTNDVQVRVGAFSQLGR